MYDKPKGQHILFWQITLWKSFTFSVLSLDQDNKGSKNKITVPLKSKLTVPRASILETSQGSSLELRVEKVNELVVWLISREINCTNGLPVLQAIVPLSLVITKIRATNSIVNTDKGTRVFSCDVYANQWMNLPPKQNNYAGEFSRLKIHSLALQHEKKNTF